MISVGNLFTKKFINIHYESYWNIESINSSKCCIYGKAANNTSATVGSKVSKLL